MMCVNMDMDSEKVHYVIESINFPNHCDIMIELRLNNVSMEESNDPVDGDKDERQQRVVHKGEPKSRI